MRNSLSPGLRISRADGGHSFSYSLPRLRIAGSVTYTDELGKPIAVDVSGLVIE